MKTCKHCGVTKPFDQYYRAGKYLRSECKSCAKAGVVAWQKANPGKVKERKARYFAANRDRIMEVRNDYLRREAEQVSARRKAFHAAHPYKARAYVAAQRARELGVMPAWASPGKMREFYFAADFLEMVTGDWYHVDHIVPLNSDSVSGLHNEFNLQVLTAADNLSKGNRHWPDMP